jgi:tripartite-type tricarboxylate transporter receptor subunit TctC
MKNLLTLIFSLTLCVANAQTSTGSGFFISRDGYFITNDHVVDGATEIKIRTTNGNIYKARLVKSDAKVDLALLKVDDIAFAPVTLGNSLDIRRGEQVFVLGFPQIQIQGLEPKLTEGSISSLSGMADNSQEFQISNPIQPGNSGGPLFLESGKIVGVVASRLSSSYMEKTYGSTPQNVNYAIKSSLLLEFIAGRNISLPVSNYGSLKGRTEVIANVEKSIGLVIASGSAEKNIPADKKTPIEPIPIANSNPFPEKPIRLIVPFAPGGPSDRQARLVASAISTYIQGQVIIENVLGESGISGTKQVLQSKGDGYTLLFQNTSLISTSLSSGDRNDWLFRDLTPIGKILDTPLVLVTGGNSSINDIKALVARVDAGIVPKIAHGGTGTTSFLCASAINRRMFKNKAELVSYQGTAPALVSVIGSESLIFCDISAYVIPHIKSRKLKSLSIASDQRVNEIFDTLTMVEQGVDLIVNNWSGIFAPKGVPVEVLQKISRALKLALSTSELRAGLIRLNTEPSSIDQAEPMFLFSLVQKNYSNYRNFLTN